MANTFSFQMGESFLDGYLQYVKQLKADHPEQELVVQISVELIPDGIGYEMAGPPQISVVNTKEAAPAGRESAQTESGE